VSCPVRLPKRGPFRKTVKFIICVQREPCQSESISFLDVDLSKNAAYNPQYYRSFKELYMAETEIGKISEFFAKPVVAGIDLSGGLTVGDKIHIKGHTTDLEMTVASMQVDNKSVNEAFKNQAVGIKVPDRVRPGDVVYKVT
jgi:translation initiation factor IF-2